MSVTLLFVSHVLLLFKRLVFLDSMFFIVSILFYVLCYNQEENSLNSKDINFFLTTFVASQVGFTLWQITEVLAICFGVSA